MFYVLLEQGYGVEAHQSVDEWGANDSVIYGMQGGFYKLDVDAGGVTWTQPIQDSLLSVGPAQYDKTTGLLYWADWAYDPVRNMQAGNYGGGGQSGISLSGGCHSVGKGGARVAYNTDLACHGDRRHFPD